MSDLRLREKIREIEKAATTEDRVPERAKFWGITLFTLVGILVILALLILAILSFIGGSLWTGMILGGIAAALSWIGWNLWHAPKLP
ncbi:hypothetical protein ACFO0S_03170 [Chryseomicrobium palamuruense]|uniref:DUF3040 domain-containing protein n=1 Tax=Chryseomicrobium palamuruense TaxID=682973 RepID=A0ABV8USS9_9BACL